MTNAHQPVRRRSIDDRPPAARPARRQGARRRTAVGDRARLIVTTDRLSAFDRIIAGVPYKGQVLNQLSAWWFEQTADIVANHRARGARPERHARRDGARRCRSRSSCAATSPASPTRRCGACTPTARARSTATTSPTGCAKNTALPHHDRHADHQGRTTAATTSRSSCADVVDRRASSTPALWERVHGGGARAVRPRQRGRRPRPA